MRSTYIAYNTYADTREMRIGFANTWAIIRCSNKAETAECLAAVEHKLGQIVSRDRADEIFRRNYLSVGKDAVPLFQRTRDYVGRHQKTFHGDDWRNVRDWFAA